MFEQTSSGCFKAFRKPANAVQSHPRLSKPPKSFGKACQKLSKAFQKDRPTSIQQVWKSCQKMVQARSHPKPSKANPQLGIVRMPCIKSWDSVTLQRMHRMHNRAGRIAWCELTCSDRCQHLSSRWKEGHIYIYIYHMKEPKL